MEQRRFEFVLEAQQPIAHAQESLGNTQVVMRQKVRQRDGTWVNVPIITGDTMRHGLREAATYATLEAAGLLGENLTEEALRLLFAGGMITGSSGGAVNLGHYRDLVDLVPSLALLGGCAQNRVVPGRVQVDAALLICRETMHLLPDWVHDELEDVRVDGSRAHVEEVTRVRMDPALDPAKRQLMLPESRGRAEQRMLASEAAGDAGDNAGRDRSKSTMMPFNYERVAQGSQFFWRVTATLYSDLDRDTFLVMVAAFLRHAQVGGKRGTGHGLLFPVKARNVTLANFSERTDTLALEGESGIGELFRAHVAERAEKLRSFLGVVVA